MLIKSGLEKDKWTEINGLEGLDGNGQSVVITLAVNDNVHIYPINTNTNLSWYQGQNEPDNNYFGLGFTGNDSLSANYDGVDNFYIKANKDTDVIIIITKNNNSGGGGGSGDYRIIYGTGQKKNYDPDNVKAIEDDNLGVNGLVTVNSRYIIDNPFGDVPCLVVCELLFLSGKWGLVTFQTYYSVNLGTGGAGIIAGMEENNKIIVQTGQNRIYNANAAIYGQTQSAENTTTSAQCRVFVFKIGD